MAKVKIISTIKNLTQHTQEKQTTNAIYKDGIFQYKDNDVWVEIHIKKNAVYMIRQIANEVKYEFFFREKNSICRCHLLESKQQVEMNLTIQDITMKENGFSIEYQLENDVFQFQFSY